METSDKGSRFEIKTGLWGPGGALPSARRVSRALLRRAVLDTFPPRGDYRHTTAGRADAEKKRAGSAGAAPPGRARRCPLGGAAR